VHILQIICNILPYRKWLVLPGKSHEHIMHIYREREIDREIDTERESKTYIDASHHNAVFS
jgi:hypothetical protein